jgi:hypothetical protein
VGSTQFATQLDPNGIDDPIRAFQDAVGAAVTPFDGHVAKLMGEGEARERGVVGDTPNLAAISFDWRLAHHCRFRLPADGAERIRGKEISAVPGVEHRITGACIDWLGPRAAMHRSIPMPKTPIPASGGALRRPKIGRPPLHFGTARA